MKRANYQSFVWKKALEVNPDICSPVGYGWVLKDGVLEVVWVEQLPAPESVLEMVTCNCRRLNCNENCRCRVLSLECTDVCKCHGNCENITYDIASDFDDDENDEDTIKEL